MRNLRKLAYRSTLVCGVVLVFASTPANARWQQQGTSQEPAAQPQTRDNDVTRQEVADFDRFLDNHPDIDKDLQANPSLVDDSNYVQNHPNLQAYLSAHPNVSAEVRENPNYFMRRENRFERSPADRDQNMSRNGDNAINGPGVHLREVGQMDQFLDEHPAMERQLQQNPSLINDQNFLGQHQDLDAFLSAHPQVRAEFDANPTQFMQREARYERSPMDRDNGRTNFNQTSPNPNPNQTNPNGQMNPRQNEPAENPNSTNPNPDLTMREEGRTDQFFDEHHDTEQALKQNPSLINNQSFLAQHQDLEAFLNAHPRIQAEFDENPSYFMQQHNVYENSEADQKRDTRMSTSRPATNQTNQMTARTATQNQTTQNQATTQTYANNQPYTNRPAANQPPATQPAPNTGATNPNPDLTRQEVARMDQFLDDHPDINKELEKNPSLINDTKWVDHHKALATFLNDHPQIREEFDENPRYFMNRENQFEGSAADRDVRTAATVNVDNKNVEAMGKFLEKHKSIAKDLDKEPSRASDQKYLSHHKDLRRFFEDHGEVRTEYAQNPRHFMDREQQFERHDTHRMENRKADQDKRLDQRADTDHRSQ